MNDLSPLHAFGVLTDPQTLEFQRLLPGSIARVWAFVTESDLRRRWLAAGEMTLEVGAPFELVWRNAELSEPPGERPEGMAAEHRMQSRITAVDPPRKLSFTWFSSGEVTIELEPRGDKTLLTLIHQGIPDHATLLGVSAGWHAHFDVLYARLQGSEPAPHWDNWVRLREIYAARMPA